MVGAGVRASLISSCMLEAPPENPKPPGPSTALVLLTTPGETGPSGKKPSPTFFTDTAGGSGALSTPCARAPSALSRRTEGSYFQGPEPGSRPKETRVMGARFMRLKKEIALTFCAAAWKWDSALGWRLGSRGVEGKMFWGTAGKTGVLEEALEGAKRDAEEMVGVENLAAERGAAAGSFGRGENEPSRRALKARGSAGLQRKRGHKVKL
jgi:hypothetical protein